MNLELVDASGTWAAPTRGAFNQVFGRARSPAVWQHIYTACPDGSIGIAAVDANGNVMGHYGATVHRLYDGRLVALARDAFTHPGARYVGAGKKPLLARLFRRLSEEAIDRGCDMIYGFSSERHFRLGAKILGYRMIGHGCYWHLNFPSAMDGRPQKLGTLVEVKRFPLALDNVIDHVDTQIEWKVRRDSRYLNWRFSPDYGGEYRLFVYSSFLTEALSGYCVLARSGTEWQLADWVFPASVELCRDIWTQLGDWMRGRGGRAIACFCTEASGASAQLKLFGGDVYQDDRFGVLGYFPLSESAVGVGNMGFALTLADMDAL